MKVKSIFILLVVVSNFAFSQDKITYLDSLYREVSESNYQIKRVIKDINSDKNEYKVYEYNQDERLILEGTSTDKNSLQKIGVFTTYFSNGNKKESINYEGFKPFGKHIEWYENGNKKLEGEFLNLKFETGQSYKIIQFWDENNVQKVVDGNGLYQEKNKLINMSGLLKNGYKDGEWKGFMFDKYKITEEFEDGKFIFGESTDNDNITVKYSELEQKPEPVDGINNFYKYIGSNFNYTKKAIKQNINGKIIIQFVIDKEGKVTELKVFKGLGYGLDEEAIRVVSSYKNWKPGLCRGRKVSYLYTLPINLSGF
jgi:TonB family protein